MDNESTPLRKKEHIELCLTDKVAYRQKSNGFEHYEFRHNAVTEVSYGEICLDTMFFGKVIDYPFMISSMTGGTTEAGSINAMLAEAANSLNIPIGIGSQRQALENDDHLTSYSVIREKAPDVPVLANIGASQFSKFKSLDPVNRIIDLIEADALIIHLNALQELMQARGEPDFSGLLKNIEKYSKKLSVPLIVKETGAGIDRQAARSLLDCGVKGIDVAGSGGTSWAAVEILRNKDGEKENFWDWGLPTSYCIRRVSKLKKQYEFLLIASGGVESGVEIAKSIALGADMTASARIILQQLERSGTQGVEQLVRGWFEDVKRIMFLCGCSTPDELKKIKLIKKEELF